jgi:dipeptidyl aminopeptidase/acylaminoacyl peptidase
MNDRVIAPYGSWLSPIDATDVASEPGRANWIGFVGDELWWTESRPTEGGRVALVRRAADGSVEPVLPAPWSVRCRVLEYGGQAWCAVPGASSAGPLLVFSEYTDQRLYAYRPDQPDRLPWPLTPEPDRPSGMRYAEPIPLPARGELWCVRETMTGPLPTDVRRDLVAVPLDGGQQVRTLIHDRHFVACPRLAPDGGHLAWIGWEHPNMPWDHTEIRVAPVDADGNLGPARTVGAWPVDREVSVAQIEWADPDALYAAADPDNWWNIYRVPLHHTASGSGSGSVSAPIAQATEAAEGVGAAGTPEVTGAPEGAPVNVCPRAEEFAGALWSPGLTWFRTLPDGRLAVTHGTSDRKLSLLEASSGTLTPIDAPYTEWAPTLAVSADGRRLAGVAANPTTPYEVVGVDLATLRVSVLRPAHQPVDTAYLSAAEHRVFTGADGRDIHTNLYPPRSPAFAAPDGELPPYLVYVHGGPTSRVPMVHDLEISFFTSRGIGVVEVNYGGSTGYGRAYRERLREQWGVVDVEDSADVARALVAQGLADPDRLAIRGGSAGGWTSAAAICQPAGDVFRTATILYPILDLAGWRTGETHDFESQYLDSLVGSWPDARERYEERSPVNRSAAIRVPFLLLQGLDDGICPPIQCDRLLERLAGRDVPHAYLTFAGETHGFRKDSTIVACLHAELSLYGQVFGFAPRDVPKLELSV